MARARRVSARAALTAAGHTPSSIPRASRSARLAPPSPSPRPGRKTAAQSRQDRRWPSPILALASPSLSPIMGPTRARYGSPGPMTRARLAAFLPGIQALVSYTAAGPAIPGCTPCELGHAFRSHRPGAHGRERSPGFRQEVLISSLFERQTEPPMRHCRARSRSALYWICGAKASQRGSRRARMAALPIRPIGAFGALSLQAVAVSIPMTRGRRWRRIYIRHGPRCLAAINSRSPGESASLCRKAPQASCKTCRTRWAIRLRFRSGCAMAPPLLRLPGGIRFNRSPSESGTDRRRHGARRPISAPMSGRAGRLTSLSRP